MVIKVDVTGEDIAFGQAGAASSCPIALAIKRAMPGADSVNVSLRQARLYWRVNHYGGNMSADLPTEAINFVLRFDAGDKPEPLKFLLSLGREY